MTGTEKLKRDVEAAGWHGVAVLPDSQHKLKAVAQNESQGRYTIVVDAGKDGHIEGYQLARSAEPGSAAATSDRVPWSRGVPTPAEAVGRWEEQRANGGSQ